MYKQNKVVFNIWLIHAFSLWKLFVIKKKKRSKSMEKQNKVQFKEEAHIWTDYVYLDAKKEREKPVFETLSTYNLYVQEYNFDNYFSWLNRILYANRVLQGASLLCFCKTSDFAKAKKRAKAKLMQAEASGKIIRQKSFNFVGLGKKKTK